MPRPLEQGTLSEPCFPKAGNVYLSLLVRVKKVLNDFLDIGYCPFPQLSAARD